MLSCHHQRNSDTPKAANTKPLCTLCPTRALEPWIRRFTIYTDLVQREGNGEVKIQYRKAQAERRSLAQPPPELGMALLRTVLSIFSREKTASTCMQLLTCTRTNPARNNLSCNREYMYDVRRPRQLRAWTLRDRLRPSQQHAVQVYCSMFLRDDARLSQAYRYIVGANSWLQKVASAQRIAESLDDVFSLSSFRI